MTEKHNIALLVITDGRGWCLQRTLNSFQHHVGMESITGIRVVVNDAAEEPAYQRFVDELCGDFDVRIPPERSRRGFGGAITTGWDAILARGIPDYIFHLEDDFEFRRPIDLDAMATVLDGHPDLVQLCLRRQPWNSEESAAGGIVEMHPDEYVDQTDGTNHWLEHRLFFSTNPSLYRGSLLLRGWPQVDRSEGHFSIALFNDHPEARVAFWGHRSDEPWIHHIGVNRVGAGY